MARMEVAIFRKATFVGCYFSEKLFLFRLLLFRTRKLTVTCFLLRVCYFWFWRKQNFSFFLCTFSFFGRRGRGVGRGKGVVFPWCCPKIACRCSFLLESGPLGGCCRLCRFPVRPSDWHSCQLSCAVWCVGAPSPRARRPRVRPQVTKDFLHNGPSHGGHMLLHESISEVRFLHLGFYKPTFWKSEKRAAPRLASQKNASELDNWKIRRSG